MPAPADHREQAERLAPLLALLDTPVRLRVVVLLGEGPRNYLALCDELGLAQPTVNRGLTTLCLGGAVAKVRDARRVAYALTETGEALAAVATALIG